MVDVLVSMGFDAAIAQQALMLSQDDVEAAANMLLTNPPPMPMPTPTSPVQRGRRAIALDGAAFASAVAAVSPQPRSPGVSRSIDQLVSMGFDGDEAEAALEFASGDVSRAANVLLQGLPPASTAQGQVSHGRSNSSTHRPPESSHALPVPINLDEGEQKHMPGASCSASSGGFPGRSKSSVAATDAVMNAAAPARQRKRKSDQDGSAKKKVRGTVADDVLAAPAAAPSDVLAVERLSAHLEFGKAAFAPLRRGEIGTVGGPDLHKKVPDLLKQTYPDVKQMRGERGQKPVTQMLSDCYDHGLFTLGSATSAVNSQVVPAFRHIVAEMERLPAKDPKRVGALTTLAHACQDCQQVQAREILRIYGDLTSQSETFETQLRYSLVRQKEAALQCLITRRHPGCDQDHTQIQPHQQRAHLLSGYVASPLGELLGLDGPSLVAAKHDRFLSQVKGEVGRFDSKKLMVEIQRDMSVKEWLQTLLADINNQSPTPDRLIDRNCIFKWVQESMSVTAAREVFYDEARKEEFADHDPKEPNDSNKFQPFLSCRVLVDMLLKSGMLRRMKD